MCTYILPLVLLPFALTVSQDTRLATENDGLFEGDIELDEETRNAIFGEIQVRDTLIGGPERRWPGNTMTYTFDSRLSSRGRTAVRRAMRHITAKTKRCIKFKQIRIKNKSSNQGSYVRFFPGEGCYSSIGRISGNQEQRLSIGRGCEYLGVAAHEIMHALGFYHEQSRLDRDNYVTVMFQNIRPGTQNNFRKYAVGEASTLGAPYDYGSIMHYRRNSFTKNGKDTLVPKDANVNIGQRNGLSPIDTWQLMKLYKCPGLNRNPPSPPASKPSLNTECVNHKTLSEANRIDSYRANGNFKCDSNLVAGWYRFTGAAGSHMPEKAPAKFHCGTQAPGWLKGKHPSVVNGIVGADVCFRWTTSNCQWKQRVFIRNCGRFFVYYLSRVPGCYLRFCGSNDPNELLSLAFHNFFK